MLKKFLRAAFPKRLNEFQLIGTHDTSSPAPVMERFPTPSQKPNFVAEELEWRPLLGEIKVILDDIVARFPSPPNLQYPDDDDYDYECTEATELRAKYVHDFVTAERAQANAARVAAAHQSGRGGAQIATALTEWASAIEASALQVERSEAKLQPHAPEDQPYVLN